MAINVKVQHNGEFLPDIILLTQCYQHRGGTRLNVMKKFRICILRAQTFFPLIEGCSEVVDAFRFFF